MTARPSLVGPATGEGDNDSAILGPARDRFRTLIVARILAFEAFRKPDASGLSVRQALTGISDLAHKIAGVGATLGFAKLGADASALERAITGAQRDNAPPARTFAAIEPLLEKLLDEMEGQIDA